MTDSNAPDSPDESSQNQSNPFITPQPNQPDPYPGYSQVDSPSFTPPEQPTYPPLGQPPNYGVPPQAGYYPPPGVPPYGYQQPGMPPFGYQPPGYYGQPMGMGMPGQFSPSGMWGKRVAALIIDQLIIGIPLVFLYILIIGFYYSSTTTTNSTNSTFQPFGNLIVGELVQIIIFAAVSSIYYGILDSATTGSVGKRAMKIRVIDVTTGKSPTFLKAWLRMFIYSGLYGFCYFPGLLNALWPLWGSEGRAWHDMASNTKIIDVNNFR
ncbi:MAG: hypothetical protein HKL80_07545 [Acidimicrobiales bacterium]|nr:hypothetical protein [Acidimicrobiales bacterium]